MSKGLSERIAERMKAKEPTGSGKNRAAFLAVRHEVKKALDDGWSVKVIWETLREEGKITYGYDAFIGYVNRLIRNAELAPGASAAGEGLPAKKSRPKSEPQPKTELKSEPQSAGGFSFNPAPSKEELL